MTMAVFVDYTRIIYVYTKESNIGFSASGSNVAVNSIRGDWAGNGDLSCGSANANTSDGGLAIRRKIG